jgi:hypothetical protein
MHPAFLAEKGESGQSPKIGDSRFSISDPRLVMMGMAGLNLHPFQSSIGNLPSSVPKSGFVWVRFGFVFSASPFVFKELVASFLHF